MARKRPILPPHDVEITSSLTMLELDVKPKKDNEVTRPYFLDWRVLEEPTMPIQIAELRPPTPRATRPRKPSAPPPHRRKPPRPPLPSRRALEPTQIIRRPPARPERRPLLSAQAGLIFGLMLAFSILGTLIALIARQLSVEPVAMKQPAALIREINPPAPEATQIAVATQTNPVSAAATNEERAATADTATLNFKSNPPATILLDGKNIGQTPQLGVRVSSGSHFVQYLHQRLGRREKEISLEPGATRTIVAHF